MISAELGIPSINEGNCQMQRQQGFTFWGFVFTVVPIVVLALLAMELAPSYIEYFTIKKAINRIGGDPLLPGMSDGDIRAMMDKTMEIDQIHSIKSSDLKVFRSDSGVVVSVEYESVIPLFANVSVLLDFSASSKKASAAEAAVAAAGN
jgi:hypothetical protein